MIRKLTVIPRVDVYLEGNLTPAGTVGEVLGERAIAQMGSSPDAKSYYSIAIDRGGDIQYNVSDGERWKLNVKKAEAEKVAKQAEEEGKAYAAEQVAKEEAQAAREAEAAETADVVEEVVKAKRKRKH